jgi:hypothetical protein
MPYNVRASILEGDITGKMALFLFSLAFHWQPLMHALGYDQSRIITCCSRERDDYNDKVELFASPQPALQPRYSLLQPFNCSFFSEENALRSAYLSIDLASDGFSGRDPLLLPNEDKPLILSRTTTLP